MVEVILDLTCGYVLFIDKFLRLSEGMNELIFN